MVVSILGNPEHWRNRAEEARVKAEQTENEIARSALFRMAEGFDDLAKQAELYLASKESA
jgi:hypothetical protein